MPRFFRFDDDHPFTGWHALAIVALFFAIIIVVNMVMVFYATSTFPGLVVKNSYVASQKYNETLDRARAQAATGLVATLDHEKGRVVFRLIDAEGESVHGLTVTARAGRPSSAQEDATLSFTEARVDYRADTPLNPGNWEIDIEARRGGELVYRDTAPIFIPPEAAR